MPYKNYKDSQHYQSEYWKKNKHIKKHKLKQYYLRSEYNISPEEYNQLLVKQDFKCALCGRHASEFQRGLAIDHCHETGRIRGMLCMPCNTSLGQLGDTPEAISKVLSYITKNMGI